MPTGQLTWRSRFQRSKRFSLERERELGHPPNTRRHEDLPRQRTAQWPWMRLKNPESSAAHSFVAKPGPFCCQSERKRVLDELADREREEDGEERRQEDGARGEGGGIVRPAERGYGESGVLNPVDFSPRGTKRKSPITTKHFLVELLLLCSSSWLTNHVFVRLLRFTSSLFFFSAS